LLPGPLEYPSSHAPCSSFVGSLSLNHFDQGWGSGFGSLAPNFQGSVSSYLQGFGPETNLVSLVSPGLQHSIFTNDLCGPFSQPLQSQRLVPVVVMADPSYLSALQPVRLPFLSQSTPNIPFSGLGTLGNLPESFCSDPLAGMSFQQAPLDMGAPSSTNSADDFAFLDLTSQPLDSLSVTSPDLRAQGPTARVPQNSPGPWCADVAPADAETASENTQSSPSDGSSTSPGQQPPAETGDTASGDSHVCSTCDTTWPNRRRLRFASSPVFPIVFPLTNNIGSTNVATISQSHVLMMAVTAASARDLS